MQYVMIVSIHADLVKLVLVLLWCVGSLSFPLLSAFKLKCEELAGISVGKRLALCKCEDLSSDPQHPCQSRVVWWQTSVDKYRHVDPRGSQASCSTQNGGCQVQ